MDIRRVILFSALIFIVFSLWSQWQKDYPSQPQPILKQSQSLQFTEPALQPTVNKISTASKTINVKTDVLNVNIDLAQGDIVQAELLDYPASLTEKNSPVMLLKNDLGERYVANSNLFTVENQTIQTSNFNFTTKQSAYKLSPDQKELVVTLEGKNQDGLRATKEFIFKPDSYLIQVNYTLQNESNVVWKGYLNTDLSRSSPQEDQSSLFHIGSYTGASYSSPGQHRYQKVKFKDMLKGNLDTTADGGWIAMQQHYFLSAWIPNPSTKNRIYSKASDNNYTIGAVSQPILIQPGEKSASKVSLYIGPEIASTLKSIAPGLDLTIDYGILWFISSMLFSLMKVIYSVIGNWGWSIVVVTILIKLAFYRLSAKSYNSMAAMRKLQPKLQMLRERYGDDKAKMSQATMELYRQEKINPLGGCLPIIIQFPVFIALYWVLLESVELRQAPFMLWIQDLSAADPYHVLPIIMGLTMLIQQKLNPAPPDPMQAKLMMLLPVVFTGLFWNFPSGLVLYWIITNTLSILQQWYITRNYMEDKPKRGKLVTVNK